MADNRQMIIDLDKKRMTAMAQKDVATLNALLADDLVYTHSSARLDTKHSLIGAMESGATVYTAVEPSDVKAQDLGDTVVLTGSCRISVMSGGRPNSLRSADAGLGRSGRSGGVEGACDRTRPNSPRKTCRPLSLDLGSQPAGFGGKIVHRSPRPTSEPVPPYRATMHAGTETGLAARDHPSGRGPG